ncbi:NACHT domain-containing protein [Phormidesmis sp. 146-33]
MSGSGGGGGYEYQARATAYVAVHILTEQKLDWIDHPDDLPIAVAEETDGPGDDLNITLQDDTTIELQAKHGLQKGKLWEPIIKLAQGLQQNPLLHGILLTDSTASGIIKDELREDLKRLGQGRTDGLKQITQELQQKLAEADISNDPGLFKRLSIRVLDLDDGLQNSESACRLLSQVLETQNQASLAWKVLWGEGLKLITNKGRRDAAGWAQLLSGNSIQLSTTRKNPAIIAEIHRDWLRATTTHLIVPGIREKLSIESDWLPLKARQRSREQEPFRAEFIPELNRLSVVVGEPGSGKSTLTQYLAHRLSGFGKTVLRVRLTSVRKLLCSNSFGEAILKDATSNSSLSLEQTQFAIGTPDYLLADGLDECEDDRSTIADQLNAWAGGHSTTKITVTTRIGYEPECLPNWQLLELLPLESSDILKFAKRLLGDASNETEFQNWLQTSRTISLASKNPLLLGFLIQIFQGQAEPIQNRAKLYEKIIELACKRPLQDRESIALKEPTAKRILEIVGWELLHRPTCSESDLRNAVGKQLEDDLEISLLKAQNYAEDGLSFWEQRRIFERIRIGCDDVIAFIHRTIGEYAAARYAYGMDAESFCQWVTGVSQNPTWEESILFAAELGATATIVHHLLKLDNQSITNSKEIVLAAKVLQKDINPQPELIEAVVNRLQHGLESSTRSIVFESAESLVGLSQQAPSLIGKVGQSLFRHSQSWTRLAAIRLSLASGDKYVDIVTLEEQIDTLISEAEQNTVRDKTRSKQFNPFGKFSIMGDFQSQTLVQGFGFLLRKKPNLETAERIKTTISQGRINSGTDGLLKSLVMETWKETLEKLKDKKAESDLKQEMEAFQIVDHLLRDLCPLDKFLKDVGNPRLKAKELLEKVKYGQHTKGSEQVFLEAVLRVVEHTSISPLPEIPQEFPLLGVLFQGMNCWKVTTKAWNAIEQCEDSDAVDAVLKGAIAAMDLDSQGLADEATLLLAQICCKGNLDEIEAALIQVNNWDRFRWAYEQLIEKTQGIFMRIPKVPANPKWERVKEIEISIQTLNDALDHPSELIWYNAALILAQKIGEEQTNEILRSKKLIS